MDKFGKYGDGLLAFFVPFIIYFLTLAPSVSGGDSGELINVAATLGVAHPPGFPLFTILAHVFSWLPFGDMAWRLNLFSAFCNSLAALFLYYTVRDITGNSNLSRWAGLLTAGMFSFAPWIWSYAVVAEVFALNNLILCLILFVLARYYLTQKNSSLLFVLAFLFGLAASNHHAAAFFVLPIAAFLLLDAIKSRFQWQFWLKIAVCFLLGTLPYLQLLIAPNWSSSPFVWGETTTWSGFWSHFLRADYGTFQLGHEDLAKGVSWFAHLIEFAKGLTWQLLLGGLFFVFVGVKRVFALKETYFRILLICLLAYIAVFFPLSNVDVSNSLDLEVLQRFWQQPYLIICLFMGLGFYFYFSGKKVIIAKVFCIVAIISQMVVNYQGQNQSRNTLISDFTNEVLQSLPAKSILLTTGDHLSSSFSYAKYFANQGEDIQLLNAMMLIRNWYIARQANSSVVFPGTKLGYKNKDFSLKKFLGANIDKRSIFVVNDIRITDEPIEPYRLLPFGLVDQYHRSAHRINVSQWRQNNLNMFAKMDEAQLARFPSGSWEHEIYRLYWRQYYKYAANLLTFALKQTSARSYLQESIDSLERVEPHLMVGGRPLFSGIEYYYKNLRLAYGKLPQTPDVVQKLKELNSRIK